MSGNDGEKYVVKKDKRGVQTWRKYKGHPQTPLTQGGEVELARAQERRRLRRGRQADESSDDESVADADEADRRDHLRSHGQVGMFEIDEAGHRLGTDSSQGR